MSTEPKVSDSLLPNRRTMGSIEAFFAERPSILYVRLHWVDYSGVLHTRFVPKDRFVQLVSGQASYSLAQNCLIIPFATAPECWGPGPERWVLQPDPATLRACGFAKRHAAVMCSVAHADIADSLSKCPRSAAQRVVRELERDYGTTVLVGFELEFVLLDADLGLFRPMDRIVGYSMTAGLRGPLLEAMEEVVESLDRAGIAVYHFHTEIADQLEIALAPLPPIEAVDALMLAQETVRTVFVRRGLRATMAPKPLVGVAGPQNGCHMHLSLSNAAPEAANAFIAGILGRMKAVCALGMASYDSYARVVDDGCGLWIGWGTENRDLPIRKVGEDHWEFRFLDATANVYLAVAATLAAGLDGIRTARPLAFKDCPVFLQRLTAAQLGEYGITERMATSLRETLDAANADDVLRRGIGPELLAKYSDVREREIAAFSRMDEEQRRKKYLAYF